jgi:hypothetical protein
MFAESHHATQVRSFEQVPEPLQRWSLPQVLAGTGAQLPGVPPLGQPEDDPEQYAMMVRV